MTHVELVIHLIRYKMITLKLKKTFSSAMIYLGNVDRL